MGRISSVETRWIKLPLREKFVTSKGKRKMLESLIYEVVTSDGIRTLGESPTSTSYPNETIDEMNKVADSLRKMVLGRRVSEYEEIVKEMRKAFPYHPLTLCGLEQAIFRAHLFHRKTNEFDFWGAKRRSIETDITVPFFLDSERLKRWVTYFRNNGFNAFKLKLSGNLIGDKIFIDKVAEILKDQETPFTLRLDMNEAYDLGDLISLIKWLKEKSLPIDFLEQPLRRDEISGLKEAFKESPYPIILDESVRGTEDIERTFNVGEDFGVNIKIAKSGILEAKKIYDMARRFGLKVIMGCMLESLIGLSSSIFFALGHGDFDYIDLDSVHFLYSTVNPFGIKISGPTYLVGHLDFSHDPM